MTLSEVIQNDPEIRHLTSVIAETLDNIDGLVTEVEEKQ